VSALLSMIEGPPGAPVLVLFGGSPHRRHEVLQALARAGGMQAHGALSEAEGMDLLARLPRVDVVLIGGRYTEDERVRIRAHVRAHLPNAAITEPGHDYPYDTDLMIADVKAKLGRTRR
jgi:hypothetical protein